MKILIHFRHFPVAMGRWFDWAFRDLGHEVWSVGCYNGPRIPWGEQYSYPDYDFPPDYEIPEIEYYPIKDVLEQCPFKPDMVFQAGDTTYLKGNPGCLNVILGTDPHVVNYQPRLEDATHYISMQNHYLNAVDFDKKFWVPYGYKADLHIKKDEKQEYDVVFIGLQYDKRVEILDDMSKRGYRVYNNLGKVYDEYVGIYNKGLIAFNFSSREDLPARFWEGLAMGRCVVTNAVPDLKDIDFIDGVDYISYRSPDEAIAKMEFLVNNPILAAGTANNGYMNLIKGGHTYKDRAEEVLKYVTS